MIPVINLFADLPPQQSDELVQTISTIDGVRIEQIVSRGHASPPGFWYDQPQHEAIIVLAGAAALRFEDEEQPVELQPGDFLNIPAHRRHRVEWTMGNGPTIWLAVRYGG